MQLPVATHHLATETSSAEYDLRHDPRLMHVCKLQHSTLSRTTACTAQSPARTHTVDSYIQNLKCIRCVSVLHVEYLCCWFGPYAMCGEHKDESGAGCVCTLLASVTASNLAATCPALVNPSDTAFAVRYM
jgi:hypothetical protein